MNKRVNDIDILKGMLILFVVIGHYPFIEPSLKQIIFWFHMPLFFVISGYLFKRRETNDIAFYKITNRKYIIPYISYFLLVIIFIERNLSLKSIIKFLYGGRMQQGVYWFIPCLVITIVVFNFLLNKCSKKINITIFFAASIIASLESLVFSITGKIINLPLNIDVCLLTLVYFSIGFYLKDIINKIIYGDVKYKFIYLFSAILCSVFIILSLTNKFGYIIDLKYSKYSNIILNLLLPLIFGIILIKLSTIINKTFIDNIFIFLGRNTLSIMFLHVPINSLLLSYFNYGMIVYVLNALIVSIAFNFIVKKFRVLNFLFNGVNLIRN